jgi:hypothetical protein
MDVMDILAMNMENVCSYFCFNHLCLLHNMFVAQIARFHYFCLEMLIAFSLLLFNFSSSVIIKMSTLMGLVENLVPLGLIGNKYSVGISE